MRNDILFKVAISFIPGIGPVLGKNLISYCGSAEAVFKEKKSKLIRIPGIGISQAELIISSSVLNRAEQELKFMQDYGITAHFYTDESYPKRLLNCYDCPLILFGKGHCNFNADKVVAIVGTRKATDYGKQITEELVKGLKSFNVLVVSGLAYGIDIKAHKACLEGNLPTVAVMATSMDKIYPGQHKNVAQRIMENGALLSEFVSGTKPDRENFPKRNRIVAGMSDAVIVVESAIDGGSIITAELANGYKRDVFAFPGDINRNYSKGCNQLIATNSALLISSIDDLAQQMKWTGKKQKSSGIQKALFQKLSAKEQIIVNLLKEHSKAIDRLKAESNLKPSEIAEVLLNLEFYGLVRPLPGKMYRLA